MWSVINCIFHTKFFFFVILNKFIFKLYRFSFEIRLYQKNLKKMKYCDAVLFSVRPRKSLPSQRKSRISFRKNKINVTVSWNVKVWCFSIWTPLTFYNWNIDYFLQSTISVWSIRVITNNHSKFKVKKRHTTFYLRI